MNAFDITIYHFFNHFAGHYPLLDRFMSSIAQFSLEMYAVLFLIAWVALPKKNTKSRHALVVAGFGGILALLLNFAIAHIWFRPRPFVTLPQGTFTQLIPHAADASFPSDHASGSIAFASGAWKKTNRWISLSFSILAILVPISRIYTGVHWPTDILASIAVGIFSGKIIWLFSQRLVPLTNFGLKLFRYGHFKPLSHK